MIDISGLTKYFDFLGNKKILYSNLNLNIKKGEIVSILGPNGCGKSTLLNIISSLDNDFEGKIQISDNTEISYMFQKDLLIPWKTVYENIILGIKIKKKNIENIDEKISGLLKNFDLEGYEKKYPNYLSGGEKQKISLIRSIVMENNFLLMDEPFSAIDFNSKMKSYKWLLKYIKDNSITLLFVTHDIDEAVILSDRIIIMNNSSKGIIKDIKINIDKKSKNFDPIRIKEYDDFSSYLSYIWKIL